MTPNERSGRPGGPRGPGGSGSGGGKPGGSGRPGTGREGFGRPGAGKPGGERSRDKRTGARRDDPGRENSGDRRPEASDRPRPPREDAENTPVFPPIFSHIAPDQLDRQARRELSGLGKEAAEFVAKHLVMAALVVDDDPALAHQHANAALFKGSRIPVVRESVGITAYLVGDFALCLRELRTHRRLSGHNTQLPMMVDAERGLGRPERGVELARGIDRSGMPDVWVVELAIALSGARLDMEQTEQALVELQIPQLDPTVAFSYSPGLFDAYAVVLEDLGRVDEASVWGQHASAAAAALSDKSWSDHDDVGDIVDSLADGEEEDNPASAAPAAGEAVPRAPQPGDAPTDGAPATHGAPSELHEARSVTIPPPEGDLDSGKAGS